MQESAKQYQIDMNGFPEDEFDRVYELLNTYSYTDIKEIRPKVFTFIWNEPRSPEEVTSLPSEAFQLILGKL